MAELVDGSTPITSMSEMQPPKAEKALTEPDAFGLTDIGCQRANNEDCYRIAAEHNLYIVSDGMGGAPAGEVAAQLAVEEVLSFVGSCGTRDSATMIAALTAAHNRVAAAAVGPQREGMGCTLVAALIDGMMLYVASVGDSRAYIFGDGGCQCVSIDQTWVNEVGRKLGLHADDLERHPYRHVLTVAVGTSGPFRVNSYALPIAKDTQVLLCTDGLHDIVSENVICETMLSDQTPEEKCRSLVAASIAAGAPDNVTVVAVDLARYRRELLARKIGP